MQPAQRLGGAPPRRQPQLRGLAALERMGLAARTYVNVTAPWALTDAGAAKARELGVLPPLAAAGAADS